MSGVVSTEFRLMVPHGKLKPCIALLEAGLRSLKRTPYHRVLGKDFLPQAGELAAGIVEFYRRTEAAGWKPAALYLEMNGFTINPSEWHCDLFGYREAGDVWELDWLSEWDAEGEGSFVLRGMGPVQAAFAELFLDAKQSLGVKLAGEVAEHIVTARFMELVAAAHKVAKRRCAGVRGLPILATAHDWDTIHLTE